MVSTEIDKRPVLPVICGPTAVGKTALALQLAEAFDGEIISADSRQVFRLMDIGTAKPTLEEQQRAKHHLIDVAWPDEEFHAAHFLAHAEPLVKDILQRNKRPFLVGGTGLYIKAFTEGLLDAPSADQAFRDHLQGRAEKEGRSVLHAELAKVDPESAARLHPNDLIRIVRALEVYEQSGKPLSSLQDDHGFKGQPYRTIKICLHMDRDALYQRINQRAKVMFEEGLLEEAESLLKAGYDPALKTLRTIGYRQAFALLSGAMTYEQALESLQQATRRYAKQQLTWFRKDKSMIWLESSADFVTIRKMIDEFYCI